MSEQLPPPYRPYGMPGSGQTSGRHSETRRDVDAALAARAELGPEYDEHVAAGLAERVEQLAAYRSAELRHASEMKGTEDAGERSARTQRFVLGIVSLATGIPITAVSANLVDPSLLGVMVSWAGIVGVNIAAGLRRR